MGVSGSSNFLSVYSENFALKGRVGDDHPRTREAVPIARAHAHQSARHQCNFFSIDVKRSRARFDQKNLVEVMRVFAHGRGTIHARARSVKGLAGAHEVAESQMPHP